MRKILSVSSSLLLLACGDSGDEKPMLPATDTAACFALGADYDNNVGTLAVVGLPSLTVLRDVAPGAISGDPVVRAHDGRLYVVNRLSSNVTVIDPVGLTVEKQFSTGAATNPQDIALQGDKAYVTLYGHADLQIWDLSGDTAPAAPLRTVSLAAYDPDGVPQANSVVVTGGRAYVTLDLLDTESPPSPRGIGKVVILDTTTDAILTAIDLNYENPYDFMYVRGDRLIVSTFADFSGQVGCLEQIALTGEPRALDCLVENSEVNGIINAIAVGPTDTYLAVSRFDEEFKQQADIRRLDAEGNLVAAAMTPAGQIPTDVAYAPTGHLLYADRSTGGLRVLDLATGAEITPAPLPIGLTPATANGIVCLPR